MFRCCWFVRRIMLFDRQISHVVGVGEKKWKLVCEISVLLFLSFDFPSRCFPHYAECNPIEFIPDTWLALEQKVSRESREKYMNSLKKLYQLLWSLSLLLLMFPFLVCVYWKINLKLFLFGVLNVISLFNAHDERIASSTNSWGWRDEHLSTFHVVKFVKEKSNSFFIFEKKLRDETVDFRREASNVH